MTADAAYLASLRSIRPREVEQFQQRRDNGIFRDTPPVQALFELAIIAAWRAHQDGEVVTPETIRARAPELTELQIAELCESPYFRQALAARGIPGAEHLNELSAEQLTALQVMTDPTIGTPVMARLKRLKISYKRWQGWLRQPVFAATYQDLLAKLKADSVGPVTTALQMEAAAGKVDAAKLVLELAGVYTPGGAAQAADRQTELALNRLYEAIDRFVDDDDTRRRIAHFVKTGQDDIGELVVLPSGDDAAL